MNGEVPEWSNGADSKSVVWVTGPGVRIPPSPPTPIYDNNVSGYVSIMIGESG